MVTKSLLDAGAAIGQMQRDHAVEIGRYKGVIRTMLAALREARDDCDLSNHVDRLVTNAVEDGERMK